MNRIFIAAAALLLTATPVLAQATSNDVTPAERTRAERAVRSAGYVPRALATAQAGTIFFTATMGGTLHYLTVTANGQVMPGTTIPAPAAPAAAR